MSITDDEKSSANPGGSGEEHKETDAQRYWRLMLESFDSMSLRPPPVFDEDGFGASIRHPALRDAYNTFRKAEREFNEIVVEFNIVRDSISYEQFISIDQYIHPLRLSARDIANKLVALLPRQDDPGLTAELLELIEWRTKLEDRMRLKGRPVRISLRSLTRLADDRQVATEARALAIQSLEKSDELNARSVVLQKSMEKALEKTTLSRAHESFVSLAKGHAKREGNFMLLAVLSVTVILSTIGNYFGAPIAFNNDTRILVAEGLHRLAFLGFLTVWLRLAVKRWNLERNLRILYEHRCATLQLYDVYSDAIPESDPTARNALRMEFVRTIFSDPTTGYRDENISELSGVPLSLIMEYIKKLEAK